MIVPMVRRLTFGSSVESLVAGGESDDEGAPTALAIGTVQVRLIGAPQLLIAGRSHILERKDAALLALLASERSALRERAAALIWSDVGGAQSRANLRQRLHRMRRLCGFDLVVGSAELRLADAITHDLLSPHLQLEHELESLDGDLLATLDYADCGALSAWVEGARERWRRTRRDALSTLCSQWQRQERLAAALACAERLVRDEPAFEAAHRMLMRLHVGRGDRAAALAAYERCREALALCLGTKPDNETRALHRQVLRGETDAAPARPQPVAVLRPPRLIGREKTWTQLLHCWSEHRAVVLVGEPGIGKTRLLTDFAMASPGSIVVGGQFGDTHAAYALLARLLRVLVARVSGPLPDWIEAQLSLVLPERGGTPAKSWSPVRLRQTLLAVIERTAGDVQGVLIDDAQFGDIATLQLLTNVCLEEGVANPNWLIASRAGEMPDVLTDWIKAADPRRVQMIRIEPLDDDSVKALLNSLALPALDVEAVASTLSRQTGGNPLFLLEVLRSELAAMGSIGTGGTAPPRIDELILRRLAQLPVATLDLAHTAALAGQDFDAGLAANVLQRHPMDLADPWRELELAQVMRGSAFAHDLIREATLRSVPAPRAVDLHARIATWLEQHDGEPARVAVHWKAAGFLAQAGRAYAAAAERLRSRVRRDEETRLLKEADACFEVTADHDAQADVLLHLFRAHWDRKDRAGMRNAAAKLQQVARSPVARMNAAFVRAQLETDERPGEASLALVHHARELAERHAIESGTEGKLAEVLVWQASVEAILNQSDAALQSGRRVAEIVPRLPYDRWRGHVHFNLGFTFEVCGDLSAAMAQFDFAERMFVELDEPVHISDTRSMSSISLFQLGRLREATHRLQDGRRMWAEMNGGRAEPLTADVWIARFWRDAGKLGEALALLQETVDRAASVADLNLRGSAAAELAGLHALLGQPARALSLLPLVRAAPKAYVRFDGLLAEARVARAMEESPDAALNEARALLSSCMRADRLGWLLDVERARSMPALEAVALMRTNAEAAQAMGAWHAAAPSRALWIDALVRAGDGKGAGALARVLAGELRQGETSGERPPMTLSAAEYWLILHRAFAAAGDQDAARDARDAGVSWVRHIALPSLPDEFRESFVHRNPINRALLGNQALTPQ